MEFIQLNYSFLFLLLAMPECRPFHADISCLVGSGVTVQLLPALQCFGPAELSSRPAAERAGVLRLVLLRLHIVKWFVEWWCPHFLLKMQRWKKMWKSDAKSNVKSYWQNYVLVGLWQPSWTTAEIILLKVRCVKDMQSIGFLSWK